MAFERRMKPDTTVTTIYHPDNHTTMATAITMTEHEISNGLCRFSPTSTKGKWIFLLQTILISFIPIGLLMIQNGVSFNDMLVRKQNIQRNDQKVEDLRVLARLIIDLQIERSAVALSIFLDSRSGRSTDLSEEYAKTDKTLSEIVWKKFGNEKVFETKLRFQIKIDDFRDKVTLVAANKSGTISDVEVLEFYNLATSKMLGTLEEDIGNAQTGSNWRILLSYFNVVQILESSGIGLIYGLRFYSIGILNLPDITRYVRTNALLYEYYRQAKEMIPPDVGKVLAKLFDSEDFKIVDTSTNQILENIEARADLAKGQRYFEGTIKFMNTLTQVLNMLTDKVKDLSEKELTSANTSQIWGIALLVFVMILSPILVILAKNAIQSIQVFAVSVEKKSEDMKRVRKKQDALIYKMLPKVVVDKLNTGMDTADTFDAATLYFSSVIDFTLMTRHCSAMDVVDFLNNLYTVMDKRMDEFDVYKVETISDSYLVASGLPKTNGDKHTTEICNMALDLLASCHLIVRPDTKPNTIQIKAGIHTGSIVAGVVGSKMPRYCLFGDTINTASRMQSTSEGGKIQISSSTNMMLEVVGGYKTEQRGEIEVKGKGMMTTFWLLERKNRK